MFALSTRLRCNRCNVPLPGEAVGPCPSCGADLCEVGGTSEMTEWGRTRQLGRGRFIRQMTLRFGLIALLLCAAHVAFGRTDTVEYAVTGLWPICGFVLGWWHWRSAERDYAAWRASGLTPAAPDRRGTTGFRGL